MAAPRLWQHRLLCLCVLSGLVAAGCGVQVAHWNQARHEKVVDRQTTLPPAGTLDVDTSSGSVTITGSDTTECHVVATIMAQAPSEEEAQELAEQVEIRLDRGGDTLKVRAEKPKLSKNRSISVSYAITAPRKTNVQCHSSYGSLNLVNLEGVVNGKTGSGSIEAEDIVGATNLDTSYGSVTCRRITGAEVTLHSGSGSITATDIEGSARINSSYGTVKCERFSGGDLFLKSGSGSVTVSEATFGKCEASSSYGPVAGTGLKGDLIKFRSGSGSVKVIDGIAQAVDLSSSYGSVKATRVTTGDLKAHSGSGSVRVECTADCPSDLTADATTSYGSIDFTAPPAFAGRAHLATSYGSVRTDRPITISGKITKKKIVGTIGAGNGNLRLQTGSGSIELR